MRIFNRYKTQDDITSESIEGSITKGVFKELSNTDELNRISFIELQDDSETHYIRDSIVMSPSYYSISKTVPAIKEELSDLRLSSSNRRVRSRTDNRSLRSINIAPYTLKLILIDGILLQDISTIGLSNHGLNIPTSTNLVLLRQLAQRYRDISMEIDDYTAFYRKLDGDIISTDFNQIGETIKTTLVGTLIPFNRLSDSNSKRGNISLSVFNLSLHSFITMNNTKRLIEDDVNKLRVVGVLGSRDVIRQEQENKERRHEIEKELVLYLADGSQPIPIHVTSALMEEFYKIYMDNAEIPRELMKETEYGAAYKNAVIAYNKFTEEFTDIRDIMDGCLLNKASITKKDIINFIEGKYRLHAKEREKQEEKELQEKIHPNSETISGEESKVTQKLSWEDKSPEQQLEPGLELPKESTYMPEDTGRPEKGLTPETTPEPVLESTPESTLEPTPEPSEQIIENRGNKPELQEKREDKVDNQVGTNTEQPNRFGIKYKMKKDKYIHPDLEKRIEGWNPQGEAHTIGFISFGNSYKNPKEDLL